MNEYRNICDMFEMSHRRGVGVKSNERQVRITVTEEKSGKKSLSFCIGVELMQQLRWVCHDRVTIDFDCANSSIAIRRVTADYKGTAWALGARSTGKGMTSQYIGKTIRSGFSITATPVMLKAFGMDDCTEYIPEKCETGEHGLRLPLRKKWTVSS